jgi:hypothetical protein
VVSTTVAVNKETTFMRKLHSQMQFMAIAEAHRDMCARRK